MIDCTLCDVACFGVVPVFVNAGAALLPAILAGLTSIVSLVLRPAALWRACAAKPAAAIGVLLAVAAASAAVVWMAFSPGVESARKRPAAREILGARTVDWAAMADRWLMQENVGGGGEVAPATAEARQAVIFGGSPLRNSYAGGGSPAGLSQAWSFPAAGSKTAEEFEGAMFLASPAVVDGALYGGSCLLDMRRNYGTLFRLNARTGEELWTTSVYRDGNGKEREFKGFFSSPAVTADGKHLVIGQGLHTDDHCELLCINTTTGAVKWSVATPLHIEGSPAVDGDLAVVGAGAIEEGDDHHAKGHKGLVIAVKISTGEKMWQYEVADPESSPAIKDGIVYIGSGFNGNAVVALRAEADDELKKRGADRLLWRTPTPYPATGAITLVDDLAIVGCGNGDYVFADPQPDGAVIALDCKTGKERWKVRMPDGVLGKVAVFGGTAIVPVRNGEVLALDLAATPVPTVRWRQRVSGDKAILAGAAFTGKHVYAVSQDGYLAVLDAADGKILERHYLNAKDKPGEMGLSVSSPTVAGGRVYVGSETGGLRCFAGKEVKP
jgi:outer membrane protein assembly factor BamB